MRSYAVVIISDMTKGKVGKGHKARRSQVAETSSKQMKLNAKVRGAMVTRFLIKL